MKDQIVTTWNTFMDYRFNPLKHLDTRSAHYLMQVLSWMWSMIFSLSFLSIFQFGYVWAGHMLLVGGVFITISIFKRAETLQEELDSVQHLSRGGNTVWKMDSEA